MKRRHAQGQRDTGGECPRSCGCCYSTSPRQHRAGKSCLTLEELREVEDAIAGSLDREDGESREA